MIAWLGNWAACVFAGLMGHGWKTPKRWDEEAREKRLERKKWALEKESLDRWMDEQRRKIDRERLACVAPFVYHGETPAKEPVVTLPQMDSLPNPTSVIYLFVVVMTSHDNFQVVRVSSEDPRVPCFHADEECADDDDFGLFESEDRAKAVAKKLNDEERTRRFA